MENNILSQSLNKADNKDAESASSPNSKRRSSVLKRKIAPKADVYYEMNSDRSMEDLTNELIRVGMGEDISTRKYGDDDIPPLSILNYLNLLAFISNVVASFGEGVFSQFGEETIVSLSEKYEMLLSPPEWLFGTWVVIFVSQGIFISMQMMPAYRTHPLVRRGVNFRYLYVCCLQVGWVFALVRERYTLSLACILSIWICLGAIVLSQNYLALNATTEQVEDDMSDLEGKRQISESKRSDMTQDTSTFSRRQQSSVKIRKIDFFLLCFPFELHLGWIIVAAVLNVNIIFVAHGAEPAIQIAVAILSLLFFSLIALCVLLPSRPNYISALVVAFSVSAITNRLSTPSEQMVDIFGAVVTKAMQYASAGLFTLMISILVIRGLFIPFMISFLQLRRKSNNGKVPKRLEIIKEGAESKSNITDMQSVSEASMKSF